MIFFGLALSILIFSTGDLVTLATMIPGWTIVMIFTLWPMMTPPVGWITEFVKTLVRELKRVVRYLADSRNSEEVDMTLRTSDRVA